MAFAVEVVTLAPALWPALVGPGTGVVGRAFGRGQATLTVSDLRDFGRGPHRQVDDAPFGGGAGMVISVAPLHAAIVRARGRTPGPVVLLTPRGERLAQPRVQSLAAGPGMTLVCGRFEGVDERVHRYVDLTISLADVVLSAGDPAAYCLVDAVVRLRDGALGNPHSLTGESFAAAGLAHPQYTRPAAYDGESVPSVLLGGDHAKVAAWRAAAARALTAQARPDLLSGPAPSAPPAAARAQPSGGRPLRRRPAL